MRISVPSASLVSTPVTTLVTSIGPSSHCRSHNRGRRNHSRSQQSWPLPNDPPPPPPPPQYRPTTPLLSPRNPAPLTLLGHSPYLGRCQICGIIGHSARQCSYLSTSTHASLQPVPTRAQCLTFTTPYAHSTIHYSNLGNSLDWVVDSCVSHHVTMDLATFALHEPYTTSNSVVIGDGIGLSIANIGSFTLTSLHTPLLFSNVLHVPVMSKNLICLCL